MPSEPRERCRIHTLDAGDLRRAVDDPALMMLVHEGWTVLSTFVVRSEHGGPEEVALVMAPPAPASQVERDLLRWAPRFMFASVFVMMLQFLTILAVLWT